MKPPLFKFVLILFTVKQKIILIINGKLIDLIYYLNYNDKKESF